VGWLEWPAQREGLRQALAKRLATLFADEPLLNATPPPARAAAGRALAQLGDPRPGVGVAERDGVKLPDILWSAEIPAGRYVVGGKYGFDVGEISIDRPYRLARYPITNAQFRCFIDAPDREQAAWWRGLPQKERRFREPRFPHANHPRETVSWYQAIAFCRWLTARLHAGDLPRGPLAGDLEQYIITLPHEYEWEVAARWPNDEMKERIYPWGSEFDAAKANTSEGGIGSTTAVGLYPSGKNPTLDLYDLSGNVWEWCRNRYETPDEDLDPEDVNTGSSRRVVRGGSWYHDRDRARSAYRHNFTPSDRDLGFGFRVVCVARRPPSHQDH
jgi:formylglycine-generating enzyme required for sulfatase activity